MAKKILVHPVTFTGTYGTLEVEYSNMTNAQYVDPDCIEACEELKDVKVWALHMVSGKVIGIFVEEFLKHKKAFLG